MITMFLVQKIRSKVILKKGESGLDGFRTKELALEWSERRHLLMTALVFDSFEVFLSKEGRRQDSSGRWVPIQGCRFEAE